MHAAPVFSLKNFPGLYVKSIQAIFLLTATLKFLTVSLGDSRLDLPDGLLWMFSIRQVLMLVGFFEMGIIFMLAKSRAQNKSFELILWVAAIFLIYHLFLRLAGSTNSYACHCFGGFLLRTGGKISLALLIWMILGSSAILFQRWRKTKDLIK